MTSSEYYIPILDNGHGGIIGGEYQTAGKRSPNWLHGILYEGAFNRWVVNRLIERLDKAEIPYYHVCPELEDISLQERIRRVNAIHPRGMRPYLLSIHANAGGGEGLEIYTSRGTTLSDSIAELFLDEIAASLPNHPLRIDTSDGDRDKEANFYVLKHSRCPAILVEAAFMDNESDYQKLFSEEFIDNLVEGLFWAVDELYRKGV